MARKKSATARKPAAKKKVKVGDFETKSQIVAVESPISDIFSGNDRTLERTHRAANAVLGRRDNRPTGFTSVAEIRREYYALAHFYLRYLFQSCGIPKHCWIDIIGGTGIGKTTLGYSLLGNAIIASKAYCLVVETEEKPPLLTQIWRCLHWDPKVAAVMAAKAISHKSAHSLDEMVECVEEWLKAIRGFTKPTGDNQAVCLNRQQPVFVFIDTMSKLMTPAEAVGVYAYGKHMKNANDGSADAKAKKGKLDKSPKKKEIGVGSNFTFSKFMHEWFRKVPAMLRQYNAVMICSHHQNVELDMAGNGGMSWLPPSYTDLFNKSKIGGRATDQNATFQLILAKFRDLKNTNDEPVGKVIRARMDKNSIGSDGNIITYHLNTSYPIDTADYLAPAITYDQGMLEWMQKENIFDVRQENGVWQCPALHKYAAAPEEVYAAMMQDPSLLPRIGNQLKIEGYYDAVAAARNEDPIIAQE